MSTLLISYTSHALHAVLTELIKQHNRTKMLLRFRIDGSMEIYCEWIWSNLLAQISLLESIIGGFSDFADHTEIKYTNDNSMQVQYVKMGKLFTAHVTTQFGYIVHLISYVTVVLVHGTRTTEV